MFFLSHPILSPFSSDSLSPPTLFLLYLLESNKKFIQIIKFFKFILNLDPKFIKPSPKKNHQTHITNQTQNANVVVEEENAEEEEEDAEEAAATTVEKSTWNLPKITTHSSGEIRPKPPSKIKPKLK